MCSLKRKLQATNIAFIFHMINDIVFCLKANLKFHNREMGQMKHRLTLSVKVRKENCQGPINTIQ